MTKIEELNKAMEEVAEAGMTLLKKSQMALSFAAPADSANAASNKAMEASDRIHMEARTPGGKPVTAGDHKAAAGLHHQAAQAFADAGDKHGERYHRDMAAKHDGHHKAYTRTNAAGTASQIKAMGSPVEQAHAATKIAKRSSAPADHRAAAALHRAAMPTVGSGDAGEHKRWAEFHDSKGREDAPAASSDEAAGAKLADEAATLGKKHIGDPKGLVAAIVKREYGNLTFTNGAGQQEPLVLTVRHDQNMVTIGYKPVNVGRGEAISVGGSPTMTGLSIQRQKETFDRLKKGLLQEIQNSGIKIEDAVVEENSIFFVSDDMIPGRPATPPARKSAHEVLEQAGMKHSPGTGYKPELDPYQTHKGSVSHAEIHKQLKDAGYSYTAKGESSHAPAGEQEWHSYDRSSQGGNDKITLSGDSMQISRAVRYAGPHRD